MAKQTIDIGSAPNDGTGDTARVGGDKINDNFTELYDGKSDVGHTHTESDITDLAHTTDAADLVSGVLANARVQESNVTQHEAALTITESQISDLDNYVEVAGDTMTGNLEFNDNLGLILGTGDDGSIVFDGTNLAIDAGGSAVAISNGGLWCDGTTGGIPATGAGARLMWIPSLGTFYAGVAAGTEIDSIGSNAVVLGSGCFATGVQGGIAAGGTCSVAPTTYPAAALGSGCSVTGAGAGAAIGFNCTVSALGAASIGASNNVSGVISAALGFNINITGDVDVGIGANVTNDGNSSVAIGTECVVGSSGNYTSAIGGDCYADYADSSSIGSACYANAAGAQAFGRFAKCDAAEGMVVGVGISKVNYLTNSVADQLAFGMNSTIPTMVITDSGGIGQVGTMRMMGGAAFEFSDVGDSHTVSFAAPALTANTTYTLPTADGNAGEKLTTDGGGVLTWEGPAAELMFEGTLDTATQDILTDPDFTWDDATEHADITHTDGDSEIIFDEAGEYWIYFNIEVTDMTSANRHTWAADIDHLNTSDVSYFKYTVASSNYIRLNSANADSGLCAGFMPLVVAATDKIIVSARLMDSESAANNIYVDDTVSYLRIMRKT